MDLGYLEQIRENYEKALADRYVVALLTKSLERVYDDEVEQLIRAAIDKINGR